MKPAQSFIEGTYKVVGEQPVALARKPLPRWFYAVFPALGPFAHVLRFISDHLLRAMAHMIGTPQ